MSQQSRSFDEGALPLPPSHTSTGNTGVLIITPPAPPRKVLNFVSKTNSLMLILPGTHCSTAKCTHVGSQGVLETKQKKFRLNGNKICFGCVSVCFVKTKTKNFGFFVSVCFEPISKQPKQIELFRNKPEQPKIFWKIPKYALYQTVSVGLLFVSVQSKHRNSLFRYRIETTETNCFETNQNKPK